MKYDLTYSRRDPGHGPGGPRAMPKKKKGKKAKKR